VCFLNILLDILEVPSHSCFKELLGITNVDLVRSIALDFVDDYWGPADNAIFAGFFVGDLQLQSLVLKSSNSTFRSSWQIVDFGRYRAC
jgi:hypothetical protein